MMSNSYFYSIGNLYRKINIFAPAVTGRQIDFLLRFSRIYNYQENNLQNRLRKNDFDILSQSIKLFKKILFLMEDNHYMILGSRYLNGIPWRNFGRIIQPCIKEFATKEDLVSYYMDKKINDNTKLEIILEDSVFKDLFKIKDMTGLTGSESCCLAFNLMSEIIYHSGPDCDFVKEVFISNLNQEPDFNLWEFMRKNLLNQKDFDLSIRNNFYYGVIDGMPDNKVMFEEINFKNLSEITSKFTIKEPPAVYEYDNLAYYDYGLGHDYNNKFSNNHIVNRRRRHF